MTDVHFQRLMETCQSQDELKVEEDMSLKVETSAQFLQQLKEALSAPPPRNS